MKIAVCFAPQPVDSYRIALKMAKAQQVADHQRIKIYEVEGGAIACISGGDQHSPIPMCRNLSGCSILLNTGLPLVRKGESLDSELESLLYGTANQAEEKLAALDGAHASLFWSYTERKLVVVTDFLGMQPLYLYRKNGLLLLASDMKGITGSGLVPVDMDPAGWGGFLNIGNPLANSTMLKNVNKVESGTILSYDVSTDRLQKRTYWHWPDPDPTITHENIDTSSIVNCFREDVSRYKEYSSKGSLLLSGGFDSRFILALLMETGADIDALIFNHDDEYSGADGKYAIKVAQQDGVPYTFIKSPPSFYESRDYIQYLLKEEVAKPSLYLFIAQVASYINPSMKSVWGGTIPGPTLNHPQKFQHTYSQLINGKKTSRWKEAGNVFAEPFTEAMEFDYSNLFNTEVSAYSPDDFGTGEFFMRNITRNRPAVTPLNTYSNDVLAFTPGMNQDFFNIIGSAPLNVRSSHLLYHKIYTQHFSRYLKVPFYSKGKLTSNHPFSITHSVLGAKQKAMHLYNRAKKSRMASYLGIHDNTDSSNPYWRESKLIDKVIAAIDPSHPDLNGQSVYTIQQKKPYAGNLNVARHLLFYWQIWRWVMEGKLRSQFGLNDASYVKPIAESRQRKKVLC